MPDYLARALFASFQLPPSVSIKSVDIDDDGRYWITSDKRLLSVCRNEPRFKHFSDNGDGYLQVQIGDRNYYLHRLLALSFNADKEKEKIKNNCVVHHIDFDKSNNDLSNLCILTREKHNLIHTLFNRWERWEHNL